jgi:hypothetical protein
MRPAQPDKDQHSDIRRVISLPHVPVSYSLANFLSFFPGAARVITVRPQRGLYFRDALRTGLYQ